MTPMEILEDARLCAVKIRAREDRIQELTVRVGVHGIRYDVDAIRSSSPDQRGLMMIEFIMMKDKLQKEILELEKRRETARMIVERLKDPVLVQVMTHRYLDGMKVREIARKTNYSEDHIYFLLRKGRQMINNN